MRPRLRCGLRHGTTRQTADTAQTTTLSVIIARTPQLRKAPQSNRTLPLHDNTFRAELLYRRLLFVDMMPEPLMKRLPLRRIARFFCICCFSFIDRFSLSRMLHTWSGRRENTHTNTRVHNNTCKHTTHRCEFLIIIKGFFFSFSLLLVPLSFSAFFLSQ